MLTPALTVSAQVCTSFDDPRVSSAWHQLSPPPNVCMSLGWQRAWWDSFSRGTLLIVILADARGTLAVAPLFLDADMAFLVGSGGSDYLDLLGRADAPGVLDVLLRTLRATAPGLLGLRLYHVAEASTTPAALRVAAAGQRWVVFDEDEQQAPYLRLTPGVAAAAATKKSLVRHEKWFRSHGTLEIEHLRSAEHVLAHLPAFFEQHRSRWAATGAPSLFHDPRQEEFFRNLARRGGAEGWLRFCRITWDGAPIAFHFGTCFAGSFLWYKPSFEVGFARRSPGEVLLRHLLLEAERTGAAEFDLGLGDEAFKSRFSSGSRRVRTVAAYPEDVL